MKQNNKNINSGVLTHNLCNKKAISIANNRNYGRPNRAPGKKFRLESLKWHILTRSSAPRIHPNALDEKLVAYVVSSYWGTITTVENPKKKGAGHKKSGWPPLVTYHKITKILIAKQFYYFEIIMEL